MKAKANIQSGSDVIEIPLAVDDGSKIATKQNLSIEKE